MKKVFLFGVVAVLFGAAASCSHNNDNVVAGVDPSAEAPAIESFIAANGLDYLTQDTAAGAAGLMSYVFDAGNLNRKYADSIPVVYFEISGNLLNGQNFYSSIGTSVRYNFSQTATDNTDVENVLMTFVVAHYLQVLGEGGSVTFVTPSAYSYSYLSLAFLNGVTVPPNSPLYYDFLKIDSIRKN